MVSDIFEELPLETKAESVFGPSTLESDQQTSLVQDRDLPPLNPEIYINRELSWLEFNRRVLQEAADPDAPLLERAKFAAIFCSNLDEFFMIRVAGVKRKVVAGVGDPSTDGRTPIQLLVDIHTETKKLLDEHAALVRTKIVPALASERIELVRYADLSKAERRRLGEVFEREIFPVLTPQAIDRGRRFPHVSNGSLNLIVVLRSGGIARFARVKVPALLPRFVPVPAKHEHGATGTVLVSGAEDGRGEGVRYTWLEEVVAAHLDRLFPGSDVIGSYPFHVLRDSDVEPDEDDEDNADLLEVMRETLSQRPFGLPVRVDIDETMPTQVRDWLLEQLHATPHDLYVIKGHLALQDLFELVRLDRPDLKDAPFVPAPMFPEELTVPATGETFEDIFALVRKHDVLVHLPFQSFGTVVDFIEAGSTDADVIAIKQTLYRLGKDSPLIPALIAARDDDTQVAVLVELKARFDEENNISWAQTLEAHGVHVAYGLIGLKTHCKLTLIVRREPDGLRRYVHISTGNYNANTARIYEDIGIFSAREDLTSDVTELFNVLTGYAKQDIFRKIWVAPHGMRERLVEAIQEEIAVHERTGKGHLIFKMNSLVDRVVIRALYQASRAGVRVDLIVRGICCLRPGVKGWSETIQVRSIVGRFLEHSRIYYFGNGGDPRVYIGSADAMERNFDRRVEVVTPVESPELVDHLRSLLLEGYLRDTVNSTILQADGTYKPARPAKGESGFDVQTWQMQIYRAGSPVGSPERG
ncbi:MAG: polyphosphate kinase 1 [Thermomicrobiales bacterium]